MVGERCTLGHCLSVLKIRLLNLISKLGIKPYPDGASQEAVIIALVLLLPSPILAINAWQKRKRLDSQKDLDSIRALGWREFEELVGEAYRRQGYSVSENVSAGPDEGVDLILK